MRSRDRRRSALAGELAMLLDAGDNRTAATRARQTLAEPGASDGDREAARAALARVRPARSAVLVTAIGLAIFAAAALLGLLRA